MTVAGDAVLRIPADGGEEEVLLSARDGERLESPQLLPDGRHILFTSSETGGWDAATIHIQAIDGDERTLVWDGGSDAMWIPTRHIIYANGNDLWARSWDLDRMEPTSGVVPIVQGVQRSINSDAAQFALSDNGTLIYVPSSSAAAASNETRRSSLVWVNPGDDGETPVPISANEFRMARISPNQRRVALVVGFPGDIYIYDLETGSGGQRTFDPEADESYPLWTSDDEFLFASTSSDQPGVYSMPAEGGEATFMGIAGSELRNPLPESLSPDGRMLLIGDPVSDTVSNIAVFDRASPTEEYRTLIPGNPASAEPAFAPNGEWLAYSESRPDGGPSQIVLRPFPDVERTRVSIPVSLGFQKHPLFLEDRLLFLIRDQGIYSVDATLEPELVIGQTTERLVSGRYRYGIDPFDRRGRAWDVHPDGRLLMIRFDEVVGSAEGGASARLGQINVVANWFEELTRLVPTE